MVASGNTCSVWIVVAWLTEETTATRGRELQTVKVAHAAVWKRRGWAQDVEIAERYAAGPHALPGTKVFTFDPREPDPLGAARRLILERAS
jgi:hypothetical protein